MKFRRHTTRFWYDVAFLSFAAVYLALRIAHVDHPLWLAGGDESHHYLIASHILHYKEFPLVGPSPSVSQYVRVSPFTYYFDAFFLSFFDDPMFLPYVRAGFQFLALVMVYRIAGLWMHPAGALLTAIIYAATGRLVDTDDQLSRSAVLFFINGSFLMLLLGVRRRNFWYLAGSLLFLLVATTLHPSAVSLLGLFVVTILYVVRKSTKHIRPIVYMSMVFIALLLLLYAPIGIFFLLYHEQLSASSSFLLHDTPLFSLRDIAGHFMSRVLPFLSALFFPGYAVVSIGGIAVVLLFWIWTITSPAVLLYKKRRIVFLTLCILFPLLFSLVVRSENTTMYLMPMTGAGVLLLIYLVTNVPGRFLGSFPVRSIVTAWFFLPVLFWIPTLFPLTTFARVKILNRASAILKTRIMTVQTQKGYGNPDFFIVVSSSPNQNTQISSAVLLVPLEKLFQRRLTLLNNTANTQRINGDYAEDAFTQTNRGEYLYFACFDDTENVPEETCLSEFTRRYPQYLQADWAYREQSVALFEFVRS